jgi:hypothetical protein
MENEFVPYSESLELKKLGFDEPCFGWYDTKKELNLVSITPTNTNIGHLITAPLWQQVFRWFQEDLGYYVEPFVDDDKTFGYLISYFIEVNDPVLIQLGESSRRGDMPIKRLFPTSKERDLSCIQQLISMVKYANNTPKTEDG